MGYAGAFKDQAKVPPAVLEMAADLLYILLCSFCDLLVALFFQVEEFNALALLFLQFSDRGFQSLQGAFMQDRIILFVVIRSVPRSVQECTAMFLLAQEHQTLVPHHRVQPRTKALDIML